MPQLLPPSKPTSASAPATAVLGLRYIAPYKSDFYMPYLSQRCWAQERTRTHALFPSSARLASAAALASSMACSDCRGPSHATSRLSPGRSFFTVHLPASRTAEVLHLPEPVGPDMRWCAAGQPQTIRPKRVCNDMVPR